MKGKDQMHWEVRRRDDQMHWEERRREDYIIGMDKNCRKKNKRESERETDKLKDLSENW